MRSAIYDQILLAFIFLLLILSFGTLGYYFIENWSVLDSLYMTVISITTTGFAEIKPLSEVGRIFTIIIIILGVTNIAYLGGKTAQLIIHTDVFRKKKMNLKIQNLENHYIVCGYGRMGKAICEGLTAYGVPFVIVDSSEQKNEIIEEKQYLHLMGDATSDDTLIKAGIKKAKGLVAVIKTDAENVFTVLSARELNKNIYIVSRAIEEGTESKLIKAGADKVVKPYELGGNRMVQLLMRPGVIDFIDGVAKHNNIDISLEEIKLMGNSPLIGLTLMASPIRSELDIIIIAIRKKDDEFLYNPKSDTVFEEGDRLFAIGKSQNLNKLTELCIGKQN